MRKLGMKEVFSDDWRQTVFWLSVALAMLIVGFAFGWMWRDRPEALAKVKILEVLTAIGTVGAVLVALGSTWFAQRKEALIKEREGSIVAAQLSTSLPPVIHRLENAVSCFRAAKDGPRDGGWEITAHVQDGYSHLTELGTLMHLPDLGALAWADEEAAHLIAKAIGSIRHIQAHPLGEVTDQEATYGLLPHRYYRIARHAAQAANWLEEARRRCSRISKVKYIVRDEWQLPDQDVCGYGAGED